MRHRFHAICPYFAMFPEFFVQKHLVYSKPGELVFDPFSGRGTTPFQALLSGRNAIALDTSAVAYCITKAKISTPDRKSVLRKISEFRHEFEPSANSLENDRFFKLCFERSTLRQLNFLRDRLDWKRSNVDAFIAALILGRLHGEMDTSTRYLSNQMPRTIATKPNYSVDWWKSRKLKPPKRDVFKVLKSEVAFRFETGKPEGKGTVLHGDARRANSMFKKFHRQVSLVITSPPYPDTTHFVEDQWLRGWFLGGDPSPPVGNLGDDRHHDLDKYWSFIQESWSGMKDLLRDEQVTIVVRIGGNKLSFSDAQDGLLRTLKASLGRPVTLHSGLESTIVGGQLRSFRPNATGTKREFDFVFRVKRR